MCRVPVTTKIKSYGSIQTLSDMLVLPSHGADKKTSMETYESARTEMCSAAAAAVGNPVRLSKPHSHRSKSSDYVVTYLPVSVEVREAVGNLEAMGFTDREASLAMLQKHGNNVESALHELLAQESTY